MRFSGLKVLISTRPEVASVNRFSRNIALKTGDKKLKGTSNDINAGNGRILKVHMFIMWLSPASKASREVANLSERKNPHTRVYGVKEFVRTDLKHLIPRPGIPGL